MTEVSVQIIGISILSKLGKMYERILISRAAESMKDYVDEE